MHFPAEKCLFLQKNALSCRKMRFSGGTSQETAGNCRRASGSRASGLKNQERRPTFTRPFACTQAPLSWQCLPLEFAQYLTKEQKPTSPCLKSQVWPANLVLVVATPYQPRIGGEQHAERLPKGPSRSKNTTATQNVVNYHAVVFFLRSPALVRLRPCFQGTMSVKPKENGIRTGVVTIANHYAQ